MKKLFIVFAMLFSSSAWHNMMAQYDGARNIELLKMADKGDANAMYYLGFNFLLGLGYTNYDPSSKNIKESEGMDWLKKASEKGQIEAMSLLGRWYRDRKEYENAIHWLTKNEGKEEFFSIEKSDDNAFKKYRRLYYLAGVIYRDGETVQDFSKAKMYFEKASTGRGMCSDAICDLGFLYEQGKGGQQDYAKAKECYEKAAIEGNVTAKRLLGNLYLEGLGVNKDYEKAFELFTKAAEKGDNEARALLAKMYYYGYYVEKNLSTAYNMLLEFVNSDSPSGEAMRMLSACYRYGQGTPVDNERAEYWFQQSVIFNNDIAKRALDQKEVDELANQGIYVVDGINYEFESPNTEQINNWKNKYQRLCIKKIKNFWSVDNYGISKDMLKAEPCLVYLILVSKSIEGYKDKKKWFSLLPSMNSEQIEKLYDILYREAYQLAKIEYKYRDEKQKK